jgi:thiol-disulfide isomerase/thioredoxin
VKPLGRFLLGIGLALVAGPFSPVAVNASEAAKSALDFELAADSRFVRLSELPPRVTVVNFWRYDCPPCVREMPLLAGAARNGAVRVVAVALQRPAETEQRSPPELAASIQPPVILLHGPNDPRGLLKRFGNPNGALPHTIVLDPGRRPCAARTGEIDANWLSEAIARCTG